MKPEIKRYTSVDAVVNIENGIVLTASAKIAKECLRHEREIYFFANKDLPFVKCADAKSVLELLVLEADKGARLQILVEGDDKAAEDIALRLYSAVTSHDKFSIDFGRIAEEERWEYRVTAISPEGTVQAVLGFQLQKPGSAAIESLYDFIGRVQGNVELRNEKGEIWTAKEGKQRLCRCFNKENTDYRFRFEGKAEQLKLYGEFFECFPSSSERYFRLVYPDEKMLKCD
jgi:phosphotransferase system HPr-like phosphotransfer protein